MLVETRRQGDKEKGPKLMDPDRLQSIAARDQLWSSLGPLRPEIDKIAEGQFDGSARASSTSGSGPDCSR